MHLIMSTTARGSHYRRSDPEDHMPSDQSPDANPRHLSSLEESATREIAAELAGIKQRLNRLAQPTGATPSVIARTTAPAQSPAPTPPPAQATAPTATSPIALMTRASALKYAPIKWLWPGRIAGAKLTLLAGTPGSGKSTLAMSRGDDWRELPLR
jgi:hypothetical protein